MVKFEQLTKTVIFALLGILILTVAVPTIYISVASYLPDWTTCNLVTQTNCVDFPTDNTTAAVMPLAALLTTIVPLVLGIAILLAVITGVLALVKWGKKR